MLVLNYWNLMPKTDICSTVDKKYVDTTDWWFLVFLYIDKDGCIISAENTIISNIYKEKEFIPRAGFAPKNNFYFLFEPATLRSLLDVSLIGWYWLASSCQQLQPKALPGWATAGHLNLKLIIYNIIVNRSGPVNIDVDDML